MNLAYIQFVVRLVWPNQCHDGVDIHAPQNATERQHSLSGAVKRNAGKLTGLRGADGEASIHKIADCDNQLALTPEKVRRGLIFPRFRYPVRWD